MSINNRKLGSKWEHAAADYLKKSGYEILETNFRCRIGEIDIIAEKDGIIIFVEVKLRTSTEKGMPCEAVDIKKQKKIIKK